MGEPGGVGLTRGDETGVGGGEFFCGIEACYKRVVAGRLHNTRVVERGARAVALRV